MSVPKNLSATLAGKHHTEQSRSRPWSFTYLDEPTSVLDSMFQFWMNWSELTRIFWRILLELPIAQWLSINYTPVITLASRLKPCFCWVLTHLSWHLLHWDHGRNSLNSSLLLVTTHSVWLWLHSQNTVHRVFAYTTTCFYILGLRIEDPQTEYHKLAASTWLHNCIK